MSECPICVEKYNKVLRKEITCFNCQMSCCSSCIRKYILQSSTEAKCLHCNIQWDRRFMVNNLTRKFCDKDYRQHRLEILYQRNKCYIPRICEIHHIKKNVSDIEKKQQEYYEMIEKYTKNLSKKIRELSNEKMRHWNEIRRMEQEFVTNTVIQKEEGRENHFNRPCITPDCLGFLNNKGNCLICKKQTCLKCNIDVTNEDNHECNEDDIQQWECIKKTTKPCPSCRVRIFKITGCDQMWCTHCNTAFSWKTGTIETGAVHNPHYFDWLFDGGNNTNNNGVDVCNQNQLPPFQSVSNILQRKLNISYLEIKKNKVARNILHYYRSLVHLDQVELQSLNTTDHNYRRGLLPYLYGLLRTTDTEYSKKSIEQYDYKKGCDRELSQIVGTYLQQQRYHYHSFIVDDTMDCPMFIKELQSTMDFYKTAIERFEKEYNRSYRQVKYYLSFEN